MSNPNNPAPTKTPPMKLSEANSNLRDSIYDRAAAAAEGKDPNSVAPDPGNPPDALPGDNGKPNQDPPAGDPPPKKDDFTPPATPEPAKPDSKGDKKDDRTVPLEALHEARGENKVLKEQLAQIQEQNTILLKDLKELMTKKSENPDDAAVLPEGDYDKTLKALQTQVAQLQAQLKQQVDRSAQDEQEKFRNETARQVAQTHKDLETEGFPGFDDLQSLVLVELQKIAAKDAKAAAALDNMDGWKKIYKETIYPKIYGMRKKQQHDDKVQGKKDLKDGASLLMPGGAPPAPAKADDDTWSYEQYMEERTKRSPQPQRPRG